MKAAHLFYFLIVVIVFSCNDNRNQKINKGKEIVLRLQPTDGNPRNSEGDFIKLKDGRILFVYTKFTGGAGDHAQAHLASRLSEDQGKTWSKNDVVVVPNEGSMNVMSVSLLRLDDGRIALFYIRKNSVSDCIPYLRFSDDEAQTWSEAIRCIKDEGYHVLNNSRVIQLKNGRIVLPVALHGSTETGIRSKATIKCYFSDDSGLSWQESHSVENHNNITLQEPGLVELKDGKVLLYCRTESGVQYFSYSEDNCVSWTPIEPGNIKSPLSPASIKRIPETGDLLLVWNNNFKEGRDGGKRTPFNLAISQDEGKTWVKTKTVESDPFGWYCYTAINFVDDNVLLGHCAGNRKTSNGLETTQITRLSLGWIYDDAIPTPYIKSDKNGTIELACDDPDARIMYTLDGSVPNKHATQYTGPFSVSKTTVLQMQAYNSEKPESAIVTEYVGADLKQKALEIKDQLSAGLQYKFYEGEISKTSKIVDLPLKKEGICKQISFEETGTAEYFALVFDAFIKVPKDGKYTFYLNSNDGSAFSLNKAILIDNDGRHGNYEVSAPVSLEAGLHSIQVKYFQAGGGKTLKLSWDGPGIEKTEIPASAYLNQN